jgi:hypothetical protein
LEDCPLSTGILYKILWDLDYLWLKNGILLAKFIPLIHGFAKNAELHRAASLLLIEKCFAIFIRSSIH